MNRTTKLLIGGITGVIVVSVAIGALCLLPTEEASRFRDPSGKYTVVISKRRYQSYVPRMPGQGGDASGFVEIFDAAGVSYGRVPIEMLQLADVRWTSFGARIPATAEWDFAKRTCYYWLQDQDRQIWVRR